MLTIERKLDRWTKDCMFEKLSRMHNNQMVLIKGSQVDWHIQNQDGTVYIFKDKERIGYVDIEEGRVASINNSILERKQIQNLVNRINEGPRYETCKAYMLGIEAIFYADMKLAELKLEKVKETLETIKRES